MTKRNKETGRKRGSRFVVLPKREGENLPKRQKSLCPGPGGTEAEGGGSPTGQDPYLVAQCPLRPGKPQGEPGERSRTGRERDASESPALAVGTQLKPARDGRWVASAVLYHFQLPAEAGRSAVCRGPSRRSSTRSFSGWRRSIPARSGPSRVWKNFSPF